MNLIQKHRIYPNQQHKEFFIKQFGCCRFVWNYFVSQQKFTGNYLSYEDMSRELTEKVKPQFPFLYNVSSQCLQQTLRILSDSVKSFYKKITNRPDFKKKHWRQSCRFAQYTKVDRKNNLLYLPRMMKNPIKIILERDLPGYTMCTIVKESDDKWYACFWIEKEHQSHIYDSDLRHVGLDLGLKHLIVTSKGEHVSPSKFLHKAKSNVIRKHRALSKKVKGSRQWLKCRKRLSNVYARIKRQRKDNIHKLTIKLVSDNKIQGIAVETLRSSNLVRNHNLAKSITDASWYLLVSTLKYKLEMRGKALTLVSQLYPSTQLCSTCDSQTGPRNNLKIREWICPLCETKHNRDINAAKNIAKEADRMYHYKGSNGYLGQAKAT